MGDIVVDISGDIVVDISGDIVADIVGEDDILRTDEVTG